VVQFLVSNYHGPWLVDIAGALVSIASLLLLLRVWKPATAWRFPGESSGAATATAADTPGSRSTGVALIPWIVLSLIVFLWGLPQMKAALNGISAPDFEVPFLHRLVLRAPPVVPELRAEDAVFQFNWLSATGTALLISAVLSGLLLGLSPRRLASIFVSTLWRVRLSLVTIAAMLALGFTTRYSGLDTTMGLAFAGTGVLFPFFSPLLGWLGVALTGSDTSSNVLFGNLQQVTAEQLGISPILAAASNSTGGVMGKMIDAQSIVVARVATQQEEGEGTILRYVFFHSLALAILVGVLVMIQAYLLPGMIPRQ
jgi:lactate permease